MDRSNERQRHSNGNGRRTRNSNRRFASDYYYNYDQPAWRERDEEWYRHTYGLPAGGRTGSRRHDIAAWANPSFTTNNTNREYNRINDNERRFELGNQRGTWNQHGDESYDFGEHNQYYTSHYSSDAAKHRGKGPKGFTRSDDRIKDDINCRLTDDAFVDASEVEVTVANGEVTLTGTVPDRSSKRRAEDIAELVSGVSNVENRLRVK